MSAVTSAKDNLDIATNYFANVKPREFFKSIHQIFFWNKYFTGKESSKLNNGIFSFMKVFDAFSLLDLMDNLNNLRNHFLGKNVKDLSLLVSDTINSACDTTTWLAVTAKIMQLSSYALSWMMTGSGVTLMYSFAKNTIKEIKELENKNFTKDEKNIKMLKIAKSIFLFVVGTLLFISGWFGYPLMVSLLALLGAVSIISNFAVYMIQNKHKPSIS